MCFAVVTMVFNMAAALTKAGNCVSVDYDETPYVTVTGRIIPGKMCACRVRVGTGRRYFDYLPTL
jgi:hypothetical protein